MIFIDQTLYYTFSTIAQVQAAILALLGVFLFYRLQRIMDIQIGQGEAILMRIPKDASPFRKPRLIGAIHRKNIYGVEENIAYQTIIELKRDGQKDAHKNGYSKHVYKRFQKTRRILKLVKFFTSLSILICTISLLFSLWSLTMVENSDCTIDLLAWNKYLFSFSIVLAIFVVLCSIFIMLPFEQHKYEDVKKLRRIVKHLQKGDNKEYDPRKKEDKEFYQELLPKIQKYF